MQTLQTESLTDLYLADETAWLEAMAEIVAQGRFEDLDRAHLREYLTDMALRDRREVKNRLTILLTHLLKWRYQTDKRPGSWRATIGAQRESLEYLLEGRTLRNHANDVLSKAYSAARKQAAEATELSLESFPLECPWTVDELLSAELE